MSAEFEYEEFSAEAGDAPNLVDLVIDDSLSPLARLEQYITSQYGFQRIVLTKDLPSTVGSCSASEVSTRIFPLMGTLVSDTEAAVRQAFAEVIPPILAACMALTESEFETAPPKKKDQNLAVEAAGLLVPFSLQLCLDTTPQVAESAMEAVMIIAKVISQHIDVFSIGSCNPSKTEEEVAELLLESLMEMSEPNATDDSRLRSAELLCRLSKEWGVELLRDRIVPRVLELADDSQFTVRKMIAMHLCVPAKVIYESMDLADEDDEQNADSSKVKPSRSLNDLFGNDEMAVAIWDTFIQLSEDDIWGVRNSCAQSLPQMVRSLPSQVRASLALPRLNKFLTDSSRWVRHAVFRSLGQTLSMLDSSQIPEALVKQFAAMPGGSGSAPSAMGGMTEEEASEFCAYAFPALALALGPDRWTLLAPCFQILIRHTFIRARRAIAYALADLAVVLGPRITISHIVPAFEVFLSDLDEVKAGVLLGASRILFVLANPSYSLVNAMDNVALRDKESTEKGKVEAEKFMQRVCQLPATCDNWRLRALVVQTCAHWALLSAPPAGSATTPSSVKSSKPSHIAEDDTVLTKYVLPTLLDLWRDPVAEVRWMVAETMALVMMRIPDVVGSSFLKDYASQLMLSTSSSNANPSSFTVSSVTAPSSPTTRAGAVSEKERMLVVKFTSACLKCCVSPSSVMDEVNARASESCDSLAGVHPSVSSSTLSSPSSLSNIVSSKSSSSASFIGHAFMVYPVEDDEADEIPQVSDFQIAWHAQVAAVSSQDRKKKLAEGIKKFVIPCIKPLAADRVVNVRLALAKTLADARSQTNVAEISAFLVECKDIVAKLSKDTVPEVKSLLAAGK
eukprot:ANDGO_04994.mRNA.1 hypothetical protein